MPKEMMEKYEALPADMQRQVELMIDRLFANAQDEDDDQELYRRGEAAYYEWVADGKPTLSLEEARAFA